ncbi:MAG TPA: hypothetical protein VFV03_00875 [Solirubrobacteraceae bacterium]|nr:hypothetical protein [Solirubrobacteraceae bacterium]
MSRKYQVVLPDPAAAQLDELAAGAGEPASTLAGQILRHGIAEAAKDGKVRQPKQAPVILAGQGGERARWLEPYGGNHSWLAEMWGAIVALHGRYPRILEHLKDQWWTDEFHTEMLCALATWRAEIDDCGVDPREELAFHAQLADYARTLRQEGGGVSQAWEPGAPPREWAG